MDRGHAFKNEQAFLDEASKSLHKGLIDANLQPLIDEVNQAKSQVSAGQFGQWMQDLSSKASRNSDIAKTSTIMGVDRSGHNLIVADSAAEKGAIISPKAAPIKSLSEREASATVPQHLVKVQSLMQKDHKFSILLLPGLDISGDGKYEVRNLHDEKVTSSNGDVTHNITGSLSDKESKVNIHAFESRDNRNFTGSYTTSRTGELLSSKIRYDARYHAVVLMGGNTKDFPDVEASGLPVRGLKHPLNVSEADTTYDPFKGSYSTKVLDIASISAYVSKPTVQGVDIHPDTINTWEKFSNTKVSRDKAGQVIELDAIEPGTADSFVAAAIVRDKNENPTVLTLSDGTKWRKTPEGKWESTKGGKTNVLDGDVIVENSGDIVFSGKQRTVILHGDDAAVMTTETKSGRVLSETNGADFEFIWKYDKVGNLVSRSMVRGVYNGVDTETDKCDQSDLQPPVLIKLF